MSSICLVAFRLRKLHCFEACSVQIGDKAFYTLTESDSTQCVPARTKLSSLHFVMKQVRSGAAVKTKNKLNQLKSQHSNEANGPAPTNCHGSSAPVDGAVGKDGATVENAEAEGRNAVNKNCGRDVARYLHHEELACASGDSENAHDTDSDSSSSMKSNSSLPTTTGGKGRKRGGRKKSAGATAAPPMGLGKCLKRKRTKQTKNASLPSATRQPVRPGDQVAVEVLYTFSRISVMWQVGRQFIVSILRASPEIVFIREEIKITQHKKFKIG